MAFLLQPNSGECSQRCKLLGAGRGWAKLSPLFSFAKGSTQLNLSPCACLQSLTIAVLWSSRSHLVRVRPNGTSCRSKDLGTIFRKQEVEISDGNTSLSDHHKLEFTFHLYKGIEAADEGGPFPLSCSVNSKEFLSVLTPLCLVCPIALCVLASLQADVLYLKPLKIQVKCNSIASFPPAMQNPSHISLASPRTTAMPLHH